MAGCASGWMLVSRTPQQTVWTAREVLSRHASHNVVCTVIGPCSRGYAQQADCAASRMRSWRNAHREA